MRVTRLLFLALPVAASAMSVGLVSSVVSPVPLGTMVRVEVNAGNADTTNLVYRFRTRRVESPVGRRRSEPVYRTVVDYGPKRSFDWTTIEGEGTYAIEGSVLDRASGENAREVVFVEFSKLASDSVVVTPTAHPLVSIYSAPPCPKGARMRVQFETTGVTPTQTPHQDCDGRSTMNFYLAGMLAATEYRARQITEARGESIAGGEVSFVTGVVSMTVPVAMPLSTPVPAHCGILLQGTISGRPTATDLNGNLLWYGPPGISLLTRVGFSGTFLGIYEDGTKDPSHQTFREFDLLGNTVAETNAQRVSDQLIAMGLRPITSFHHEAIRMRDGRFLVLAGSEQIMEDMQGHETLDVLGDTILVLDRNLQVVWVWDSFDHMDSNRAAVLRETCSYPASLACSTFYEAPVAHDWLHGNSLQLTPDGNILYSARHQDWVIKIEYANGAGSGQVLWRIGSGGDFSMIEGNESLWFSHQHDAQILPDGVSLLLFDNGNTRIARNATPETSRGQVWRIDEEARTVRLVVNVDLQVNSSALGNAQLLANGNYHFDAGFIPNPANRTQRITQALEADARGNIVWGMQVMAQQYRSFRLDDLYTPPAQ